MEGKGRFRLYTVVVAMLLTCSLATGFFVNPQVIHADTYCQVTYAVTNQWTGGFGASITVQNTSAAA